MSRTAEDFDYRSKVHHWVNRLSFALRSEMQARLKAAGHDISVEEWALMMVIWKEGPIAMTGLAKATLRDRTTVTRVVDRLVAKGMLKRRPSSSDRRQIMMEPTESARKSEGEVTRVAQGLIQETLVGIPKDDLDVTLKTLMAMSAKLS